MLKNPPRFHNPLIDWYLENFRDLPWRRTKDPYLVWLSEIILQQTRVDQGMSYYLDFASAYPRVQELAAATETEVLKRWQGLGYYSRARNLHHSARYVVSEMDGKFPASYAELIKLKGVGDYTASAIASICSGQACAVVDGNVYRLLSRVFGIDTPINSTAGKKVFKELAQTLIDEDRPGDFNQAMMEFGARHCVPSNPDCSSCIFVQDCLAFSSGKVKELPVKKPKAAPVRRYMYFLVLTAQDGNTFLEKRTRGIWRHLYQFPLVESDSPMSLEALKGTDVFKEHTSQGSVQLEWYATHPVTHKLSHRDLHIHYCIARPVSIQRGGIPISTVADYPVPVVLERFISDYEPFSH